MSEFNFSTIFWPSDINIHVKKYLTISLFTTYILQHIIFKHEIQTDTYYRPDAKDSYTKFMRNLEG